MSAMTMTKPTTKTNGDGDPVAIWDRKLAGLQKELACVGNSATADEAQAMLEGRPLPPTRDKAVVEREIQVCKLAREDTVQKKEADLLKRSGVAAQGAIGTERAGHARKALAGFAQVAEAIKALQTADNVFVSAGYRRAVLPCWQDTQLLFGLTNILSENGAIVRFLRQLAEAAK
jgi:hypothetical protein